MDLDLLAESDYDSESNHSNQDQDGGAQDPDTSGRRGGVNPPNTGSDAGTALCVFKSSSRLNLLKGIVQKWYRI